VATTVTCPSIIHNGETKPSYFNPATRVCEYKPYDQYAASFCSPGILICFWIFQFQYLSPNALPFVESLLKSFSVSPFRYILLFLFCVFSSTYIFYIFYLYFLFIFEIEYFNFFIHSLQFKDIGAVGLSLLVHVSSTLLTVYALHKGLERVPIHRQTQPH